jgi:BetI-type transcriptional repressor, C-terminal
MSPRPRLDHVRRPAMLSAEEEYYDELDRELAGIETARERLARIVAGGAGNGDYDASPWMELWARALRDPELAATRAELDGRWRRAIADVVRYGQERGEFGKV